MTLTISPHPRRPQQEPPPRPKRLDWRLLGAAVVAIALLFGAWALSNTTSANVRLALAEALIGPISDLTPPVVAAAPALAADPAPTPDPAPVARAMPDAVVITPETLKQLAELLQDERAAEPPVVAPVIAPNPQQPTVCVPKRTCVDDLRDLAKASTIYFGSGSSSLDAEGLRLATAIGAAVQACPGAIIHVTGHSDSQGATDINLNLSWLRADNTVAALDAQGFDTTRIDSLGFGTRRPASFGDSGNPELDRRVEFHVLDKH